MNKPTTEQEQTLLNTLMQIPVEFIYAGRCASLCSLFLSGDFISATKEQLINEFKTRHTADTVSGLEEAIQDTLNYGLMVGVFDTLNNKYMPTESGWLMGKDWYNKLQYGWNA